MKKHSDEPICPIDYAFKRIGGKYKGRIILSLYNKEIMRYGELRRALADITPKMLTQTLRELEDDHLIERKAYREIPPKVEYSLSEIAKDLIPFITYLKEWGSTEMIKANMNQITD